MLGLQYRKWCVYSLIEQFSELLELRTELSLPAAEFQLAFAEKAFLRVGNTAEFRQKVKIKLCVQGQKVVFCKT
jgi:hypothetical protein